MTVVTVVTVILIPPPLSKIPSQPSHTVTERMDEMGNVQISQELFMQLLRFHLVEDESCEKEIKQGLEKKLDRMVMRDLYGKFKTAPTEEDRERAKKEYLDRRGVPESFRW